MGLLDDVSSSIDGVLDDLYSDASLTRDVVYRKFVSREYDEAKGYNVPVYTDLPIKAIRLRHNVESVKHETGSVAVGDVYYMFETDSMPSGMSMSDVIQDNGKELTLKSINDGFQFVYLITVSGTGL